MGVVKNISGRRFGKLTVIGFAYKKRDAFWECQCDCGKKIISKGTFLLRGVKRSCGCLIHDVLMERNVTHNQTGTRLYKIWCGMKTRCYTPSASGYELYGGRGIKVCDKWEKSSIVFMKWANNNGYNDILSIERIDVNGDYSPENCKWIKRQEQVLNTRQNVRITFKGETKILSQWAKELNIEQATIRYRLKKGLPIEQVLSVIDRRSIPKYYGKNSKKNKKLRLSERGVS